jgi:hypothetical protein
MLRDTEPDWKEEWFCADCGLEIFETPTLGNRTPCSRCGATARTGTAITTVKVGVAAGTKVKAYNSEKRPRKSGNAKKPYYEELNIPDRNRDLDVPTWRYRVIDYLKNIYRERIHRTDTGEVLRDVSEPLKSHRDRGTARK